MIDRATVFGGREESSGKSRFIQTCSTKPGRGVILRKFNPDSTYPSFTIYSQGVQVPPGATNVIVARLSYPEWVVEIEAVAAKA